MRGRLVEWFWPRYLMRLQLYVSWRYNQMKICLGLDGSTARGFAHRAGIGASPQSLCYSYALLHRATLHPQSMVTVLIKAISGLPRLISSEWLGLPRARTQETTVKTPFMIWLPKSYMRISEHSAGHTDPWWFTVGGDKIRKYPGSHPEG